MKNCTNRSILALLTGVLVVAAGSASQAQMLLPPSGVNVFRGPAVGIFRGPAVGGRFVPSPGVTVGNYPGFVPVTTPRYVASSPARWAVTPSFTTTAVPLAPTTYTRAYSGQVMTRPASMANTTAAGRWVWTGNSWQWQASLPARWVQPVLIGR